MLFIRKYCIVCGAPLLEKPLYVCRNMPAASQDLPTEQTVNQDHPVDLELCQCSGCGLVQFNCDPVPYYLDSTRAGERSDVLVKMRREQFTHLIETYDLKGKKIIEIGAGKGGFLKTLSEMTEYGVSEYGIENNAEFVRIARENEGVNVMCANPQNADLTVEGAPFDAFVSFAYPARMIDPNAMLQGVSKNLAEGGVGLIQVPSMEHLIRKSGFYDITVDHIAYYSKDTLRFLLQKNGFDILEQGEIGGLYIYAIVKKRIPCDMELAWSDVKETSEQIKEYVDGVVSSGKKVAAWCAGHFAFTILSTTGIGEKVSYLIDNAPFKQGCYAPASHVKIVGADHYKEEPVDVVMILGPLYIEEIVKEIRSKCGFAVKIVSVGKEGITEIK